jgi:hypothetical protein
VNLKRHIVRKDGKEHVYYSLSETIRINKNRTVQRRVLNLGELNTTQTEQWQRSIEVIEAEGQSRQRRLFTDREGRAPADATDACEVMLSSLSVRLGERGLSVDHVTVWRWVQRYAPEIQRRLRPRLRSTNDSWCQLPH